MKFVHMADIHFDIIYHLLSKKDNLGDKRRLDQREAFNKIINYIKENNIKYLFISGDLYEQKYVKQSTVEFINEKFKEIIDTKIFITPGNHDPYLKNSYYNTFQWSNNVNIFNGEFKKISTEEADIYGVGFTDFINEGIQLSNFKVENEKKINILVVHGNLDGSDKSTILYNPISSKSLKEKGFDYVALGHVHKTNFKQGGKNNIIYSGSPISFGFDELGEHGIIVGEVDKENLNLQFIKMDSKEFVEYTIDITEINSKEELVETLNNIVVPENNFYKIVLVGKRNFEINQYDIIKLINNDRILKLKDFTKLKYNLDEIAKEGSLKGYFVKNLLEKQNMYDKTEWEKALEIGLEILE
ncbi:MAG: DNA repair exonuclease [Oscillospiraceae bacterium]|nr:DNA repair exonuclease [Oscillospiraceae bacterium]